MLVLTGCKACCVVSYSKILANIRKNRFLDHVISESLIFPALIFTPSSIRKTRIIYNSGSKLVSMATCCAQKFYS